MTASVLAPLVLALPATSTPAASTPAASTPAASTPAASTPAPVRAAASAPATAPTPTPAPARPAPSGLPRPAVPAASLDLLAGSARELLAAGAADAADDPESRYAHAHLAALRAAAAVLASRARPGRSRRSARVRSAWTLLAEVAPELGEWAAFFAAGAGKRAAAEAGLRGVVTPREADDLVREAEAFLALVARLLGVAHQPALGADPS